jgi:hypothetical protein
MVRLVFRRYTQLLRSMCTSESLRTSTRVSSGFVLARHSSPSFGSQRVRSRCAAPTKRTRRPRSAPLPRVERILRHPLARASLSLRLWVSLHPMTRAHVRLLGPCFKTGRTGRVCERRTDDRIGRRATDTQSTPAMDTLARGTHHRATAAAAMPRNACTSSLVRQANLDRPDAAATAGVGGKPATSARVPPAKPPRCTRAGGRMRRRRGGMTGREDPGPRRRRAEHPERYHHPALPRADASRPWFPRRNRGPSLPFTSGRFHALLNSLFKVLFNFPSRYLFAIGLAVVFSLGWRLPPALSCTLKQLDSWESPSHASAYPERASHPLWEKTAFQRTWSGALKRGADLPEHHIPCRRIDGGFGAGLFPVRSPLLGESSLVSFPPLNDMLKFSG